VCVCVLVLLFVAHALEECTQSPRKESLLSVCTQENLFYLAPASTWTNGSIFHRLDCHVFHTMLRVYHAVYHTVDGHVYRVYAPPHMTCTYPPPHGILHRQPPTCIYPPPHMTCMYPPPHMTYMYLPHGILNRQPPLCHHVK
jgi:hypothetical protein